MFELVQQCLKDATACENMEMHAGEFLIAEEWRTLRLKLQRRLAEYEAQTAEEEQQQEEEEEEEEQQHKLTKGLPRAGKGIGRPMRKAKVQTKAALLAAQAHR